MGSSQGGQTGGLEQKSRCVKRIKSRLMKKAAASERDKVSLV